VRDACVLSLFIASLVGCGGAAKAPSAPKALAVADAGPTAVAAAAAAPPADAASEEDAVVPIARDDAKWGDRLALVTIVEFSDLQCPYCAKVAGTVDKLEASYGPSKLRVVWKNLPLPMHPHARDAAEAAEGVRALKGDEAFWRFAGRAFAAQDTLGPDTYARWVAEAGIDPATWNGAAAKGDWGAKVDRDMKLAMSFGIRGTPTFLVNGMATGGAIPYEEFAKLVDEELAKASAMIAKGVPADRVYARAAEENVKAQIAEAEKEEAERDKPDTNVYDVPAGTSPARGPKDAPVTIVEFSDFQCPFCKRVEPTLDEVRKKYGAKVRVVWKNEPLSFHPYARPAAELALEARAQKGDAAFWAAHDALFEASPKLDDDALLAIAKKGHLDVARVRKALDAKSHEDSITADEALATTLHADGTPHFFINGRRLAGAQPLEAFTAIIDEELAKGPAPKAK
jgi:protein-disulfide isomerase